MQHEAGMSGSLPGSVFRGLGSGVGGLGFRASGFGICGFRVSGSGVGLRFGI